MPFDDPYGDQSRFRAFARKHSSSKEAQTVHGVVSFIRLSERIIRRDDRSSPKAVPQQVGRLGCGFRPQKKVGGLTKLTGYARVPRQPMRPTHVLVPDDRPAANGGILSQLASLSIGLPHIPVQECSKFCGFRSLTRRLLAENEIL